MAIPGSRGEHELQERFGTQKRAYAFYNKQMLDHLNARMREFISRQEMVFVATADSHGECDCSFRAGLPGFVRVLDPKTLIYPEYRGNGIIASLGNISENPHIGIVFIDFYQSTVGLHVNGKAKLVENAELLARPDLPEEIRHDIAVTGGRAPERWVMILIEEAYIHCSKHVPLLTKLDKTVHWGTDDEVCKGGDYFRAKKSSRPWKVSADAKTGNGGQVRGGGLAKRYGDLAGQGDRSGIVAQVTEQRQRVQARMATIRHKVAIMSGKGGVGKSALTVNLAAALAVRGNSVGVIDADLNGPSAAKMLGAREQSLRISENGVVPAIGVADIKVMSMDLLLPDEDTPVTWKHPGGLADDTFVWRGTIEASTLREFFADTLWGDLDYLLIDLPPGTDRFPNIAGLLPDLTGTIVVTIPSEASQFVVKKSLTLLKEMGTPILGLVENMVGYVCDHCGALGELFHAPLNGELLAEHYGLSYLGAVPFDPRMSSSTDVGFPLVLQHPDSATARALEEITEQVHRSCREREA